MLENPILVNIGKKYGKTAAQICLRWNLQRNVIVLPKSVTESRILENAQVIFCFCQIKGLVRFIFILSIFKTEFVHRYLILN